MLGNDAQTSAGLYTDFNGLNKLRADASAQKHDADKEVAKQFEALFLQMMLKSMRQGDGKGILDSSQSDMARDLYDQQLALHLSSQGSIGIGDMMLRQLQGQNGQSAQVSPPSQQGRSLQQYRNEALPVQYFATPQPATQRTQTDTADTTATLEPAASEAQPLTEAAAKVVQERDWARLLGMSPEPEPVTIYRADLPVAAAPTYQPSELPMSFATPKSFVNSLMPAAEQAARKLGTAPQAILAVAALETGWGKHISRKLDGTPSNNLFGIKANNQWRGEQVRASTLEFEDGAMQRRIEPFRSYRSPAESVADFADFILDNPRYQDALKVAHNPQQFIEEIHKAGYATDPNYSEKVTGVMNNVFAMTQEGLMVADNR